METGKDWAGFAVVHESEYFKADPQTAKPSQVIMLQWPKILT